LVHIGLPPINFYVNCKDRAEPAEISGAYQCDLIAARQPIPPCQEALIVPIGAESVKEVRMDPKLDGFRTLALESF
jgi:hypothetical protein